MCIRQESSSCNMYVKNHFSFKDEVMYYIMYVDTIEIRCNNKTKSYEACSR